MRTCNSGMDVCILLEKMDDTSGYCGKYCKEVTYDLNKKVFRQLSNCKSVEIKTTERPAKRKISEDVTFKSAIPDNPKPAIPPEQPLHNCYECGEVINHGEGVTKPVIPGSEAFNYYHYDCAKCYSDNPAPIIDPKKPSESLNDVIVEVPLPVCTNCGKLIEMCDLNYHLGKPFHRICLHKPNDSGVVENPHNRDDVTSHNVGDSNYAEKNIQPWDIWEEYNLNPWDADIVKRVLRDKSTQSRRLDYEKIIHICQKRISQIDDGVKMYGDIDNPIICDHCVNAFSSSFKFCPHCGDANDQVVSDKISSD